MTYSFMPRTKVLLMMALLAFGLLLLVPSGCDRQTTSTSATAETIYSRVRKNGVIHVGYVPYAPAVIVDPNTKKLSGIFVETLEKAASNMGLKVEWTMELTWQTQIEETRNSSRIDLVGSSAWANSARGKEVDFLVPVYFSGICAYVKDGDHRFDNDISLLNSPDVSISIIDGDTSDFIAHSRFPRAKIVALPQSSEYGSMIQNVADSKADVTFIEPVAATTFLKNKPGSIRNITLNRPIVVYPNCMMVRKGEVQLKSSLDTAINELINSGFVDDLIRKYVPDQGQVFPVALPYRPDDMKR